MKILKQYDRKQTYLLPPSLEDYVESKYPARIINDVIDSIDISSVTKEYNGGGDIFHTKILSF